MPAVQTTFGTMASAGAAMAVHDALGCGAGRYFSPLRQHFEGLA